jgi:SAM-dependent methyltransferase
MLNALEKINFSGGLGMSSLQSYCPVCQSKNKLFAPLPSMYAENALKHGFTRFGTGEMTANATYSCTACGATDRDRLCAWWLRLAAIAGVFADTAKAIHFAPEAALSQWIKKEKLFRKYVTADLFMPGVDYAADLMNLPFNDESFDFFICNHVLEHVPNDRIALGELFRTLKKGGCGIVLTPICVDLLKTHEDPAVTDEAGRWRHFGQNDHVRLYAHDDYVRRVTNAGFALRQYALSDFGSTAYIYMGLKPTSILYLACRPE